MHLGTTPWDFRDLTAVSLGRQAQRAEALGYESFWLPENHFNEFALPDPLMLLASCAAVTERLRLGTTSYLLTLRNPIQAAEQVAVLDQLSGGRLTLGVGRGFAPAMLAAYGVQAKDKRRIFERCLTAMIAAWQGVDLATALPAPEVNAATAGEMAAGEMAAAEAAADPPATLRDVYLFPRPVQQPHPPIWVAAFGPKALAQAGRLGLPYLASPMETLDQLAANWARHRAAGADSGVTPPAEVPIMRTILVTEDRALAEQVRQVLAKTIRGPAATEPGPVAEWALIGSAAEVSEQLVNYRSRLGVTHIIATRLRIEGVPKAAIESSLERLRELV